MPSALNIQTPRLVLKPIGVQDLPRLLEILNQAGVHQSVSIIPSESDVARHAFAKAWVKQSIQGLGTGEYILGIFLNEQAEQLVGSIGLHPTGLHHEAEVGYWLDEAFQRRGIMREALECLLNYATTHTHYTRIKATCALGNTASRQLLVGSGFCVVSNEHAVPLTDGSMRPSYLLRCELST
jgi:[ribosomal protein S5]-alanine N-acetyltransferase